MSFKGFHATTEIVPEAVYHSEITEALENWGKKIFLPLSKSFTLKRSSKKIIVLSIKLNL